MERITPDESLQRISTAQQQGMMAAPAKNKKKTPKFVRAIDDNVYLFEQGEGGFVTPAYDEFSPTLGECNEGSFSADLPPALEDMLEGYSKEQEWYHNARLIEYDDDDNVIVIDGKVGGDAEEPRKTITYMCKANWGQDTPYNNLLILDGEKCLVGCWATAVGIIMQYWGSKGYHRGCTKTTKYTYSGDYHTIPALPHITVFDYRNITAVKPTTDAQIKAVGTMLKHIGAACKLRYSATGTTAWTSSYTYLKTSLRLGDNIKLLSEEAIGAAKFDKAVYDEIVAGRPVILRGAREDGSGGHFWVVDGYNAKTMKYHMNWGWKGSYNGYFLLSALTPGLNRDYTYGKYAVVGIKPDYVLGDVNNDGRVNITDVMVLLERIQQGDTSIIGDINSDGTITVDDMMLIVSTILGKQML